ncbi:potassium transporter TrkA [Halalkaliarchaeum desulfuricum]|uniref:Potassium transporter TrkA n=1 Tax=Halalkaliarchaeum desulfuricum TaxID=2055893 RepID=A0A343TKX1_9EURY|nr:TrkA C-terminal domain-containing protein [Halalkaliarchaeum desulfuricum]AUX09743.1 potassium transporter TrkA [Halalkaliarchaeum desulfuricum]
MPSLPFEILLGIYLGVLTGVIPALVAGTLGFVFRYVTGVSIPGFGVIVLALAIAGINGGLLALNDETIRTDENAVAILTAIVVVLMLALYAHAKGDKLGANVPRRMSLKGLKDRTLSADVVELVGGRGRVRVTVVGDIEDLEGYPPLSADLREEIKAKEWTFPADLPVAELESRFEDQLRTEFDVANSVVSIDERARATVAAAPPVGGLSKRIPSGKRAVSVPALVPTGLVRGESIRIVTSDLTVEGTLLSASSGTSTETSTVEAKTDGGEPEETPPPSPVDRTIGGDGRVTVAIDRADAGTLLRAERGEVMVLSRGTRREFELTQLLRRAGKRFRKVSVKAGGPLDGSTIGEVNVREAYDVVILAAKHDGWDITPRGETALSAGDELFVVGTRDALTGFEEVAA